MNDFVVDFPMNNVTHGAAEEVTLSAPPLTCSSTLVFDIHQVMGTSLYFSKDSAMVLWPWWSILCVTPGNQENAAAT
jgi:hypothetical protein